MSTKQIRLGALLAAAVALPAACGQQQTASRADAPTTSEPARFADIVIHGGPIHTGAQDRPRADFVAIIDGGIAAVGEAAGMTELIGPGTRAIDLQGAALFPGFVDAHAHLIGIGERELTLNLEGTTSIAELTERVAAAVSGEAPGRVVIGRGWIETGWPEGRFPTREDIDPASPDNPVILSRADGHALLANGAALRAAGIDAATASPAGGRIETDAAGEPTGILVDNAMNLVMSLITAPDETRRREFYATGAHIYAAYGWTGLHNMSVDPRDHAMIAEMSARGEIGIRVYNAIDAEGLAELVLARPATSADGRVITRAVKLYADGALGSRGAALSAPYSDALETSGLLLMDEATALSAYDTAIRGGVQVATHAIGDRGNALVLDWYEKAFAAAAADGLPTDDLRWRIEHAQILHGADIPRFAKLGVIASMQPSHAIGDLYFAPARLGSDRLGGAYAWRSLVDAGAVIAGGSDAPVERGDPAIEFYAAVARAGLDGFSNADWRQGQSVSRAEALAMFTAAPAYASFMEDRLGTIEVGKRADLTAFSKDLMTVPATEILDARAVLTMVDGDILFEDLGGAREPAQE